MPTVQDYQEWSALNDAMKPLMQAAAINAHLPPSPERDEQQAMYKTAYEGLVARIHALPYTTYWAYQYESELGRHFPQPEAVFFTIEENPDPATGAFLIGQPLHGVVIVKDGIGTVMPEAAVRFEPQGVFLFTDDPAFVGETKRVIITPLQAGEFEVAARASNGRKGGMIITVRQ